MPSLSRWETTFEQLVVTDKAAWEGPPSSNPLGRMRQSLLFSVDRTEHTKDNTCE